jgi:hypothetical protein
MRFILKKTLNRIFISLFIFSTVVTAAYSGAIYSCVDRDGNPVVTSFPQDGMRNCILKESFEDQSPPKTEVENKNATEEKVNTAEKKEDENKESQQRIEKCINCCSEKKTVCYNYTANERLCAAEKQGCIDTCNSEGASTSSWSDCWSQSEKQANTD